MTSRRVEKITKDMVGVEVKYDTWERWETIKYVGEKYFITTSCKRNEDSWLVLDKGGWIIRTPEEKEKSPKERIQEITGLLREKHQHETPCQICEANAIVDYLQEQWEKSRK